MNKCNDVKSVINHVSQKEWTNKPYSIQSWGSWLHRISPYVGRIKPSFANFLIESVSKEGEIIFDPFCGIGTIPTQAALMGRDGIGNDLNPYAYYIALSKTDNKRSLQDITEYLESIVVETKNIDLSKIPDWVREYYNQETLKEILFLIDKFKKDKQYFLLGCLIGISQGHRPGHLSKPVAWTLPYKPRPDDPGEYRETIPRLLAKVGRTYKENFQVKGKLKVYMEDARKLSLADNSVDHIVTSPPYYDTLDYVGSHRLRLAIAGYHDEIEKKELRKTLIQKYDTYLKEMEKTISELSRVLKPGGYCIFIVGDCFKKNKVINTAEELLPILKKYNLICHSIIEDEIPMNKSVQKTTSQQKHDRIMIMVNNKDEF